MGQQDFRYGSPVDANGERAVGVSVFADEPREGALIAEDCNIAGIVVMDTRNIGDLRDAVMGEGRGFSDVVYLDLRTLEPGLLGLLCRLDGELASVSTKVIIGTSIEHLDDVFGCFSHSDAQILVRPSRVDRVLAFSSCKTTSARSRVKEMSTDDRMALLRLTEQVGQMAERVARLSQAGAVSDKSAFSFEGVCAGVQEKAIGSSPVEPALCEPDPQLIRQIIRARQTRSRLFAPDLFADPAWDMLLDLTAAHAENRQVSVTSLCIAACVPATTALRWIDQMIAGGWFEKQRDTQDGRRAFVSLSGRAWDSMARYFANVQPSVALAA